MTKKLLAKTLTPIDRFIENKGILILDGGLATELERRGHNLNHPLWSAQLMLSDPEAIGDVHLSFLEAGSDCLTTASYQASYPGCLALGMSKESTTKLLKKTVETAVLARREFLRTNKTNIKPIIAASVGPYGAYLANGAEYTGNYSISNDELYDFHGRRWEVLAGTPADLMACETIPSYREARVLSRLIRQTPDKFTYVSFTCRDEERISDGTPIKECAELFAGYEQVVAIGINCTPPKYISNLIKRVRAGAPNKAVVVYPNSGEIYDGKTRTWKGETFNFAESVPHWIKSGVRLIGGCCRVGPEQIRTMRTTKRVTGGG